MTPAPLPGAAAASAAGAEVDSEARRVSLCLSEIARTLESSDDSQERVRRVLELTRYVVPYRRCAVLCAAGPAPRFVVTPDPGACERGEVEARLARLLELMTEGPNRAPGVEPTPGLTIPITALDQVIGVLSADGERQAPFDTAHLRVLAVVAAQLGAYFSLLKLRDDEARTAKELAAAHDFQQLLVAIVSHDLRNPLSVITVGTSSLLRRIAEPGSARTLERTLRCAKQANRIIADLLDVTSARVNGALGLSISDLVLNTLLEDVVDQARQAFGASISLTLPNEPIQGMWDAGRVAQAVGNLLSNAVQHGQDGGAVQVALERTGGRVRIEVTNTGAPISAELLPVIFDPFKQSKRTPRKAGGGLGLGLYIVKQIVTAHGGEVSCRSDEKATCFVLELPLQAASRREEATVLVVDDDVDARDAMADALEAQGYRVTTAANGARALEHMRRGARPVAVLVDLHMPVMDGATLIDLCRDDPKLRPIPLLLVSSDQEGAAALTGHGAAGFLKKPLKMESLFETLARLTRSFAA